MKTHKEISRSCKECGGLLLGRLDQQYCSDVCRTSANNKRVRERVQGMPECVTRIQKALLQNHKVLTALRSRGSQLFSKLYLMDLGFNFHHITSMVEKEGTMLFYCFNEGYTIHNDQVILLPDMLA